MKKWCILKKRWVVHITRSPPGCQTVLSCTEQYRQAMVSCAQVACICSLWSVAQLARQLAVWGYLQHIQSRFENCALSYDLSRAIYHKCISVGCLFTQWPINVPSLFKSAVSAVLSYWRGVLKIIAVSASTKLFLPLIDKQNMHIPISTTVFHATGSSALPLEKRCSLYGVHVYC